MFGCNREVAMSFPHPHLVTFFCDEFLHFGHPLLFLGRVQGIGISPDAKTEFPPQQD